MKSLRIGLAIAVVAASISAALAGAGTITVKDGGGVSRTFDIITDGSGNFVGMFGVCDGAAAAQCAAVKAASTAAAQTDPALVVRNPDLGTIGDAAWTSGNGTVVGLLKAAVNGINAGVASTGSGVPSQAVYMGVNVGGNLVGIAPGTAGTPSTQVASVQGETSMTPVLASNDPCTNGIKVSSPISETSPTARAIIAASGSAKIYVCSLALIAGSAGTVSLIEGTSICTGSPKAVAGSLTAANGMSLAANGGLTLGGGHGTVASTATGGDAVCLYGFTGTIAGVITAVFQ